MPELNKEKKSKVQKIMVDAQGQSVPAQYVKPYDRERDRVARKIEKRFRDAHDYLAGQRLPHWPTLLYYRRSVPRTGRASAGPRETFSSRASTL